VAEHGGEHRGPVDLLRGRGRRFWLITAAIVLVVALAAAGTVVAVNRLAGPHDSGAVPPLPRLALGPLATDAPTPTSDGLDRVLRGPSAAKQLGSLSGVVIDPATGQRLWSDEPDEPLAPGSANKILTTAAALLTVDPTKRLVTRVLAGPTPDSVVLVGGGDPTLSTLPDEDPGDTQHRSVYRDPPKLATLAEIVKQAHPGPIDHVYVDTSMFTGPETAPGWEESDIQGGNYTPISALIADGGRTDPSAIDGARTPTPATDAGRAFAGLVGADQTKITEMAPPPGAAELGKVYSQPVQDLIENALTISDNVLAEAIARQVALAGGQPPSFAGGVTAVRQALTSAGFDTSGVTDVDGSGLSTRDKVPARLLGQIMAAAAGPSTDPRAARLRPLLWGLPVAGGTGTLDDRFADDSAEGARGWVRAKTGTLTGVNALTGVVTDHDGRLLAFAFMSNGTSSADARPKLDDVAAALRGCGCR
jgi:serine-type D-Ala-D-Ala carboxypeptidase/endopeptidase (penicillin-binding protein 4)